MYSLECLDQKDKWVGCFGSLCIITKMQIIEMDKKVKFVDKFVDATSNRDRRANESIYSLVCDYCYPLVNFQKSFDGLYYDGINVNEYSGKPTEFDGLTWCCRKDCPRYHLIDKFLSKKDGYTKDYRGGNQKKMVTQTK